MSVKCLASVEFAETKVDNPHVRCSCREKADIFVTIKFDYMTMTVGMCEDHVAGLKNSEVKAPKFVAKKSIKKTSNK